MLFSKCILDNKCVIQTMRHILCAKPVLCQLIVMWLTTQSVGEGFTLTIFKNTLFSEIFTVSYFKVATSYVCNRLE